MPDDSDEIDAALAGVSSGVADGLAGHGWRRRPLTEHAVATITRAAQNSVLTVVEISRTSFSYPDRWPIEIEATLGIGFEPALDLMPLLALPCRATLVDDPGDGREVITISGLDDVAGAVIRIVEFVESNATGLEARFGGVAAIDAALEQRIAQARQDLNDRSDDSERADYAVHVGFGTQQRLVLMTATGQADEARALLADYTADDSGDLDGRQRRRFIRQVDRRLEAGCPALPSVERTLALLPRPARPKPPSWSAAKTVAAAKRAARDTVRAQASGRSVDQLRSLLEVEYASRDIDTSASSIEIDVEMLHREQQPFGRARNAITAVRAITAGGRDVIHRFRNLGETDPVWLRPPDRASYPVVVERGRYLAVEVGDDARDWLERICADAPRRIGRRVLIDVWFTHGASEAVNAHIGVRRVGAVPDSQGERFAPAFRAAALFDEDPVAQGRLSRSVSGVGYVLEVPLPAEHDPDQADRAVIE